MAELFVTAVDLSQVAYIRIQGDNSLQIEPVTGPHYTWARMDADSFRKKIAGNAVYLPFFELRADKVFVNSDNIIRGPSMEADTLEFTFAGGKKLGPLKSAIEHVVFGFMEVEDREHALRPTHMRLPLLGRTAPRA